MKAATVLGSCGLFVSVVGLPRSEDRSFVPIVFREGAETTGIRFILRNYATAGKWKLWHRPHVGKGTAVASADYDDAGRLDTFVTNDTEQNFLFHNDGNLKFTEACLRAGVACNSDGRASSRMGTDFRDLHDDGKPELVVTALSNETFALYRSIGGGMFRDATYSSNLGLVRYPSAGWGVGIFDFNNDVLK